MSSRIFTLTSASVIMALMSATALAQAPASVNPGRLGHDIDNKFTAGSNAAVPKIESTGNFQAPPNAEKITFVLKHLTVTGAKNLSESEIKDTYKGLVGKKISLLQIYEVANKLTNIYRERGFVLTRAIVPEQEIKDGNAKIQVVEGYVSGFNIRGDVTPGQRARLESLAKKMMGAGPLNATELERYMLLMNDLPGTQVRGVLSPSKTVAGGADLTLITENKKFNGFASLDNYGSRYLGPERISIGGQWNNPFESSVDQITGTAMIAPDSNEMDYLGLGIRHSVDAEGTVVGIDTSYTRTDPSLPDNLGGNLKPIGQAYLIRFLAEHPFIRSRAFNVSGDVNFDISQNRTDYLKGLSAINTRDNIRVLRAGVSGNAVDSALGYSTFSAKLSQGVSIFGASGHRDDNLTRAAGDSTFTKINAAASRLQNVYGPFSAMVAFQGQLSANALLSSEQFGFGGSEFGRGYDYSEIVGDNGLAGKAELMYTKAVGHKYLDSYQLYSFYDIGAVWNRAPVAGQKSKTSAASAGVGTRLNFTPNQRGDFFAAHPLTNVVASRGSKNDDDWRFQFALTTNF